MTDTIRFYLAYPGAKVPERKTAGAVGYDLYAAEDYQLSAYAEPTLVETGVVCVPPDGCHVELLLRSSLGKQGLILHNSVGLVDQDYVGPTDTLKLLLRYLPNLEKTLSVIGPWVNTKHVWHIKAGDRVGQLVVRPTLTPQVEILTSLDTSDRGGLGSTGK